MLSFIKDKVEDLKFDRQLKRIEKETLKENNANGKITQVTCTNKKDFKYYTSIKVPLIYVQDGLYNEIKKEMDNKAGIVFKNVTMAMAKVSKNVAKSSNTKSVSMALFITSVCLGKLSTSLLDNYIVDINIPNRYILLKRK